MKRVIAIVLIVCMILAFASYVLIGSKPIVPGDAVDPPISVMVE